MRKIVLSIMAITMIISNVAATPEILNIFNEQYDTIRTRLDTCETCHASGQYNASNLNLYGMSINGNLSMGIRHGLTVVESLDSDGNGFTNIDEIHNLTFPGNKSDLPNSIVNSSTMPIIPPTIISTLQYLLGDDWKYWS